MAGCPIVENSSRESGIINFISSDSTKDSEAVLRCTTYNGMNGIDGIDGIDGIPYVYD